MEAMVAGRQAVEAMVGMAVAPVAVETAVAPVAVEVRRVAAEEAAMATAVEVG